MHALIQLSFTRKVADGVATHSKLYWCKGEAAWLIMTDVSYQIISEGGIYPLPLDQPLLCITTGSSSLNVMTVVSAILAISLLGLPR